MEEQFQHRQKVIVARPRSKLARSLTALLLLGMGLAVFWRFVFGDALLLYRDIGRDSLFSYYADFVHLANYIRTDGFPSWSFHIGMGQDLAYATGFLFWEPVAWLPARFIAQTLVYQHLLKVVIAGLLFFRFLQLSRIPLQGAALGSILVGFSGYMTMGSCWYLAAEELLAFTAILLGAEIALQRGRWVWLAVSVALVGLINPFYLYLCALFLCCYVPASLFARHGWLPGLILKRSLALAAVALLGVALGAAITLPYLHVVLNSPRGSGSTNNPFASFPVLGFESMAHYLTALLRFFANDMVGTGDAFRGWQNYFEAPLSYCGLISLLLLPQAFLGGTTRRRIILLLFLLWLIIPTLFPWFRYLFWLFKGDYYRTYSLFSILGLVTISLLSLRQYLERRAFNLWLLVGWSVLLIGVLFLPFEALQSLIESRLRIAVAIYLAAYATILAVGRFANKETAAAYLLLAVTAVELIHFNYITVSERQFVRKSELIDGLAANRDTVDAITELKRDDKSFYRMTVLRHGEKSAETDPNEAMLLGYYSMGSYGSFNDFNYIRFLAAVDVLPSNRETDTRWAIGVTGDFILSLFAGEKYVLVEDPAPFRNAPQYELLGQHGKSYLFRNRLSVPLGLTFSRYLREDYFLQLPPDAKGLALCATAVLDSSEPAAQSLKSITFPELNDELAATTLPAIIDQRRFGALYPTSFSQSRLEGSVRLDQNGLLVLQTPFANGWSAFQDGRPAQTVRADVGLLGVILDGGEHKVELRYRNPWLIAGAIVTLSAVLLTGLALSLRPRLPT